MTVDDEARRKLQARVAARRARLAEAEVERRRLQWLVVLAFTTWPIGLTFGPWYALWVFAGWLVCYGVGAYSSYFHRKQAEAGLRDAEDELARLT